MTLTPGSRLGVFQLADLIGRGGMGEVYRATDTKLKRQVAIKILPPSLVADYDRLARFQREAEVLASLNHPNIAAIYGLEESGGMTALVMELVEGDDLSQRIVRGAIPIDEALPIAKQIAEALEAAHEQGIIHRDLKPANIKVRPDGTVKVLDFGLAKAMEPTGAMTVSNSMAPTITTPALMTGAGMILGTAAYMSPEQAKGRTVDKRSDVWAFGAVLYEMLTGKRAFGGEDMQDTFMAIMRDEPDWSRLPAEASGRIQRVLRACLQKNAKQRIGDVQSVRLALEGAFETAAPQTTGPTASSTSRGRLAWMVTAAAVLTATALAVPAVRHLREAPAPSPSETRLEIATPTTGDLFSFALSPDGRQVVFAAATTGGAGSQLWLRPLDAVSAQPIAGTENATYPFWSPDSRSIGFFAGNSLKRIDLSGGAPQTLASPANRGGAWSPNGVILFGSVNAPLSRVPAAGGAAVAVTSLGAGQLSHRFPQFLPGGRQFLFYSYGSDQTSGVYLGSLDTPGIKLVIAGDTAGAFAAQGWLFFQRQGTLVARRFDAARGEPTGDAVTVAAPVAVDSTARIGAFSISATGMVAYRTGGRFSRQLTWFDRAGKPLGALGDPDDTQSDPALSPNGRRVAVGRVGQDSTYDIWVLDAVRTTRFTFDPGSDRWAVWSPDGGRIAFRRLQDGRGVLYQKPSTGAGAEERLLDAPLEKMPASWSPDGGSLLYGAISPKTSFDLWVLPMGGDREPQPFVNSAFSEQVGAFSPDGRWVAYESNESGRSEIYLRPFPGQGGQWQVSTAGGISPRWRPDGKELYYVAPDSTLMAVPIASTGAGPELGRPAALFKPRIYLGGDGGSTFRQQYDVGLDGRFLINVTTDDGSTSPITVIQNWTPEAKK